MDVPRLEHSGGGETEGLGPGALWDRGRVELEAAGGAGGRQLGAEPLGVVGWGPAVESQNPCEAEGPVPWGHHPGVVGLALISPGLANSLVWGQSGPEGARPGRFNL